MDFSWIEKANEQVQKDESKFFNAAIGREEPKPEESSFKDKVVRSSTLAKPVKVGASDPGRQRDSFGFVGTKYVYPQILILTAQRWLGHAYLQIEEKIATIHKKFSYDHQVIEVNNTGIHVYEVLKSVAGLPITGVNTSKNLSQDPSRNLDPFKFPSMDKNDMARWMHIQNELGNLVFPKSPSKEMIELQNQLSNIVEYKPEGVGTGNVRYIPEGQEHDDLYMALMLNCWFIREHLMNPASSSPIVAVGHSFTKSYENQNTDPNDRIIETVKKKLGKEFHIDDIKIDR